MEDYKKMSPSSQEMWGTVYDEFKKTIHKNLVPKKLYETELKKREKFEKFAENRLNVVRSFKLELGKTKEDYEKLKADHNQLTEKYNQLKDQGLDDSLKIVNLEAVIKNLRTENEKLQDFQLHVFQVKNELKKWKSEHSQLTETNNQLKDERLGDALKIDVLQAGMKTLEAEKKTFEVKFDEVSSKLKLKTHEYDSLLKSKSKSQDIKVFVRQESQNVEKSSIGTHAIKQEPEEIGVVNVPASLSSQPKTLPAKTGTKRTSHDDNRKITKEKRMKTENSDSRVTRKSTENNQKFTCVECHSHWANDVEMNHGGDPDKTGVPNPRKTIHTFPTLEAYKDHRVGEHEDTYADLFHYYHSNNGKACKICGLKFIDKYDHDLHVDIEHLNLSDLTNKQIYDLHLKYTDTD